MTQMIFVNLPVTDLDRSKAFYAALGAENDPKFTDDTVAMMRFSEAINVTLLTHEKWARLSGKEIPDMESQAQVLLGLSRDSREAVNALVANAAEAGGVADPNARLDYGFMYVRDFADPDGHVWEAMWMDADAMDLSAPDVEEA